METEHLLQQAEDPAAKQRADGSNGEDKPLLVVLEQSPARAQLRR